MSDFQNRTQSFYFPAATTNSASGGGGFVVNQMVANIIQFGADNTGVNDCSAAFAAAMASFPTNLDNSVYAFGGNIWFPPGQYYFASTIAINRQVRLVGGGSPAGNALGSAQLLFADNIDGIAINGINVPTAGNKGADGTIIDGLYLSRSGNASGTLGHGINVSCRCEIRNCLIQNFRQNGINIVANSGGSPSTNANNWHIANCRVASCGGHGLFVDGPDANAGTCFGLDCSSNTGWGIYDSSFLGNAYVGCHTASNTLGAYKTDDANARNTFVGCYAESGQLSQLISPTMTLNGGFTAASITSTTAPILSCDTAGNFYNANGSAGSNQVDGSSNNVIAKLGGNPNNGDILYTSHTTKASGVFRLHYNGNDVRWDYGNADANVTYWITGPNTTFQFGRSAPVPYAMWSANFFVGSGNNARQLTYGSAAPVSGTWGQGDIVFANNATSGGFAGWICTAAGSPGTWKTFGLIS